MEVRKSGKRQPEKEAKKEEPVIPHTPKTRDTHNSRTTTVVWNYLWVPWPQ
jgi:hypothetical protein